MSLSRHELGRWAEDCAEQFLVQMGWTLIDRNVRAPHGGRGRLGEIDLVAQDGQELVFVEVKYSQRRMPIEALQVRQIQRIRRAALAYLQKNNQIDRPTRFDALLGWGSPPQWEHLRDAF